MKAKSNVKDVFNYYDTNVLNVSECGLDDGYVDITHVVLDGDNLLLYNANPDLGVDFQDEDYEQVLLEDDDERWDDIIEAILDL